MDANPARRNLIGLFDEEPDLVRGGIALRAFGQEIIARMAGKRVHPAWVVPGGVASPIQSETRDFLLSGIPRAIATVEQALARFQGLLADFDTEIQHFANFPSLFLGLVDENGQLEHYDGLLRVIDPTGARVVDGFDPKNYRDLIAERDEPDSYLKAPYFRSLGFPEGIYRVGPLARLRLVTRCGTRRADAALDLFRARDTSGGQSSFLYHEARLIEMLFALERIEQLAGHGDLLDPVVRAEAGPNRREGIGVAEAPRGTLIHHYRIDAHGLVTAANLIIATGHNALAMNRGVLQVAQHFVDGQRLQEGMLNRVEAVIRAFDPCLACSTHALGRMPLAVRLLDAQGRIVDQLRRSGG
jgi:NAD-reducing hydrogenase large subunit